MLQRIKNVVHLLEGVAAAIWFHFPSKKLIVIGVTGTDGKTTTVNLIHHVLTISGYKTAILSTLSSAHTTTPNAWRLQKFLAQSLANGCTHAVIEVSSHAIDQNRIWGINFTVGVLSNIAAHEHLDYHRTFENYQNTKIKFLLSCRQIVANADDQSFGKIQQQLVTVTGRKLTSYGLKRSADIKPRVGLYKTKLLGRFNSYNILAAAAACWALGLSQKVISRAVATFEPLSGRLEFVIQKPFAVIVDFAHTPQAFSQVLPLARSLRGGHKNKLIHVFGATGNRDKSKRPVMAKLAAKYDDFVILTTEDTYREDPQQILAQLEKGLIDAKFSNYQIVADRKSAIQQAISLARGGDIVILTGVGHQKTINIGGKEVPWSDQMAVRDIMAKK